MSKAQTKTKIESLVRGYENDEMGIKTLHKRFHDEVFHTLETPEEREASRVLFNTLLDYVLNKMVANC